MKHKIAIDHRDTEFNLPTLQPCQEPKQMI